MTDSRLPAGKSLLLDGITQRYGNAIAVADVTLDIRGGELVALLGPSGCGKTTLLKAIAGFVRQTQGHVVIGGEVVDDLPPNRRTVGIVFQNYGLEVRGVPAAQKSARVAEMLALVKIEAFADRYPRQMSGGQQQRVAIARALAVQPSILLLDEPFSALDKNLRLDMQIEVKRIQRTAGTTTILVTHDQEEALSMADRVAVLSKGKLEQFAPPTEIYDAPGSLFVNTFVGAANVLSGIVAQTNADGSWVRLPSGETLRARQPHPAIAEGTRVSICLRPEHLDIASAGNDGLAGIVEMGLPLGASIVHEVRIADGSAIKIATPRSPGIVPLDPGTAVRVSSAVPATIFPQN